MIKYDLDRKGASYLLGVSIRTVDRYVRSGRLSSRSVDGRVWLDETEVCRLVALRRGGGRPDMLGVSIDGSVSSVRSSDPEMKTIRLLTQNRESTGKRGVDRRRHVDFRKISEEKQEIIDEINYKIGKLQGEAENFVNLRDHFKIRENFQIHIHNLEKENNSLRDEMRFRKIFTQILLITIASLLLMLPLALFFAKIFGKQL